MSFTGLARKCLSNQSRFARLNAFTALPKNPSAVIEQAENAQDVSLENHTGVFGQLVAIKDNICTVDFPTTAASGILNKFTSPYDATVVKKLRNAGAIIAGKTNMDEFGMGSHSIHSYFGPVKQIGVNGEEYSAGGSSGGSAVAVATEQATAALGTDTGGSVRLPAAYTGTVGFKPSYGLLSRWGVIAYANSLDTVGIFASNVERTRNLFNELNFYDEQDPTCLPLSTRSKLVFGSRASRPLRIGIPLEYNIATLDPAVKDTWVRALRLLEAEGHTLHTVSLPATHHALSAYYVLAPAEASSNLAKYDGVRYGSRAEEIDGTPESTLFAQTRGQGFGSEVQRRILLGAFSLSAQAIENYFIQAQKVRRLVQQDFDRVFISPNPLVVDETNTEKEGVDVLLCPTTPTAAPLLASLQDQDPIHAYMNDIFTVPASLAGLPAISVPVPSSSQPQSDSVNPPRSHQSIGIQIIGQYGSDSLVLDIAEELERSS